MQDGGSDAQPLTPVMPAYGQASLADVLPGVLAALGVPPGRSGDPLGLAAGPLAGVRRVAVLLVDGLGWHQLPLAAPYAPTLAAAVAGRLGVARPLTAGFPSTTPTSLVSLGTGAAPGAHGVLGFTVRIPGTDRVLNHVRWGADPAPRGWQPLPTLFERAAAAGVPVSVASRAEFAGTGLTVAGYGDVAYYGAGTVDEVASALLAGVSVGVGPALAYGYHPDLDRAGHVHGVDSPQWRAAVAGVDRLVTRVVEGLPPDGALVVTADHGQLDIPPSCRFDCDGDPRLRAGVEVVAGEARVRYLHTVAGAAADVIATWRGVLGDAATVVCRDEAVSTGWFGPVPAVHRERIGDVVVACRDRYVVLATATEPAAVAGFVGFHGSTTAAEMAVPLLVVGSVAATG